MPSSATIFNLDGTTIGAQQASEEFEAADYAVVPVVFNNDETLYGQSDYVDIKDIVAEWIRRQAGVSDALDKHNNPHLAVPAGALQTDANGQVSIDVNGMVIPVPDGMKAPEYITWDPQFEEHGKQIDRMKEEFHLTTDIAAVLFDPSLATGVASGEALKRLAVPTIQKILSLRRLMDDGFRYAAASAVNNFGEDTGTDPIDYKITWPDPLGIMGPEEQRALVETVNAGLVDRVDAIQKLNHVPLAEAQRIAQENMPQQTAPQRSVNNDERV